MFSSPSHTSETGQNRIDREGSDPKIRVSRLTDRRVAHYSV